MLSGEDGVASDCLMRPRRRRLWRSKQSDVFVVDRILMSKAAAAGKVWAHFHNVDVDMDGVVSSAELKALLASVSVTSTREEDFFLSVLELEADTISQDQLLSQLKTVSWAPRPPLTKPEVFAVGSGGCVCTPPSGSGVPADSG